MGNVAASGGYYIAAPANVIVAEPGTITGSIGVVGGKYSFKGLYEKLGIRKEILKRGEHADFYTDYGDYPLAEKAIVQKQIKEIYDDFVKKVALGRTELTVEDVDRLGRGRIWSGRQAKENGLVDELGGLSLAIAIAREHAELGGKSVEVVEFPKKTWRSQLLNNLGLPLISLLREGFVTPNSFKNSVPQVSSVGNLRMEDKDVETESRLQFITQYGGLSTTARLLNIIRKHRLFLLMPYHISVE